MRRKISVSEFEAMHRAGIFSEDEHLELIDGELLIMAAMDAPHLAHVMRLERMLVAALQ